MIIIAINNAYLKSGRTPESDEVYTPFYAVEPLMEFLPKFKTDGTKYIYWCPFDEEWSAFYQLLESNNYEVIRSSLSEGKDFFQYEPEKWDIVVSNPPFSKKDEVLKRLYSFNKAFAILLPVNSLQGKKRFQIFNKDIQEIGRAHV